LIFGLALIAFNVQRSLELFLVYTLLFFEKQSMKLLIRKNLSAHREANMLTAIIYSLTLGAVIYVVVAANLLIIMATKAGTDYGDINYLVEAQYAFGY